MSKDPKKNVDATVDFLTTVVQGHWIACACEILGISSSDSPVTLPAGLKKAKPSEQLAYIERIAHQVVNRLTRAVANIFCLGGAVPMECSYVNSSYNNSKNNQLHQTLAMFI